MRKLLSILVALSLMVSFGLVGASCGTDVSAQTGTIEVRITDAPPEYDIGFKASYSLFAFVVICSPYSDSPC